MQRASVALKNFWKLEPEDGEADSSLADEKPQVHRFECSCFFFGQEPHVPRSSSLGMLLRQPSGTAWALQVLLAESG